MINIIFILSGLVLLEVAERYRPWRERWRMLRGTFGDHVAAIRRGEVIRRPAWSFPVQVLGLGLLVLGFWRQWSGA
jgi:hypothetical protein